MDPLQGKLLLQRKAGLRCFCCGGGLFLMCVLCQRSHFLKVCGNLTLLTNQQCALCITRLFSATHSEEGTHLWTKMLLIQPSKWPPPRRRDFWRFEEISSLSLFFRGWSSMRTRNLKEEESKTRVRRTGKKRLSLRGQLTVFNSDSMSFM